MNVEYKTPCATTSAASFEPGPDRALDPWTLRGPHSVGGEGNTAIVDGTHACWLVDALIRAAFAFNHPSRRYAGGMGW